MQQRTLPKKVSKVRLYERAKTLISDYFNGSITSCFSFTFLPLSKSSISKRLVQRNQQMILVKIAHEKIKQSYGYVRLAKHLQTQGIKISIYAVRQIKSLNQLYCKRHKRFKRTTNSDHNRAIYDNLLKQQFSTSKRNLAWSSDITYIWTAGGWLYLCVMLDLFSRRHCRLANK